MVLGRSNTLEKVQLPIDSVGERVEHIRFGAGEILEITGRYPDMKARIRFDDHGEKLLLLKYAKLRHCK